MGLSLGDAAISSHTDHGIERVGILGGGMMGQGIAAVCAIAGFPVVVMDVTLEKSRQAVQYTDRVLRKRRTHDEGETVLDRLTVTSSVEDLAGCDLIVEAVFEDLQLKHRVTAQAAPLLSSQGIFASNTSSLPITRLAEASPNPERFIGTHFFSPVDRMALIEVICGEKTDPATLARILAFSEAIGKTAIVVNDSPGFFTSRVFVTYLDEGCRMLQESCDPEFIDAAGVKLGMPQGPLTILDHVSLGLPRQVARAQKAMGIYQLASNRDAAVAVADLMIDKYRRGGRRYGGGFYDYAPDGGKTPWPGLALLFGSEHVIPEQDAVDRLLFRQVIEALICLERGVLNSVEDGDKGSLLGIGTPAWTGGLLSLVNHYGLERFCARCRDLSELYGERFRAPAIATEALAQGRRIE